MSDAQIYSQGFRRYDGPRTGVRGAMSSLIKQSLRKSLGLGRSTRHKVIPFGVIFAVYIPVIVFVGMAIFALASGPMKSYIQTAIPSYPDFYSWINFLLLILAAFVVPGLLCSDRRTGLLGVYLASPLNRVTYLLSKAWASLLILLLVTFFPPFLLLISYSLTEIGPDGFVDWIKTFGQVTLSSLVVGLLYVAVALMISSFTDRNSFASIAFLVFTFGTQAVSVTLVEGLGMSPLYRLFDLPQLVLELIKRIFDAPTGVMNWGYRDNPTLSLWLVWFSVVAISLLVVWLRYRKLLVRR